MARKLIYAEAVEVYVRVTATGGVATVPSRSDSYRTDADDGWQLRNVNGWLATVLDDGSLGEAPPE